MCGIIGVVGDGEVASLLVTSLERLEYRGYDSCGLATLNGNGIELRKDAGPVAEVAERLGLALAQGRLGIAHTRWATHGGVSRENAHPHLSCDKAFAVVHNGIISNYQALRHELEGRGHRFYSQTDTEVFPHLLEDQYRNGHSVEEAFVEALRRLEGTFAIAAISRHDPEHLFCARERSPLLLGISPERKFVGSDVNAFLRHTKQAVVLEDGEYAVLSRKHYRVRAIADRRLRERSILKIDWSTGNAEKGNFRHYMEKEIWEQPEALKRALAVPQDDIASLARLMCQARRNLFVGVGTTYYMALFGQYLFANLVGEMAPAISSDEAGGLVCADSNTLVLAISQSGETYDTLEALRHAKKTGAHTAAIVNVPVSSMTREVELVIYQNSGPEVCVISTKAAMAQLALLIRLALEVANFKRGRSNGMGDEISEEITRLPGLIEAVLGSTRKQIRQIAHRYCHLRNWFFLGRGIHAPIVFESALKMKEVTYLHAEGMPAGFLKHGTLSLIDEECPCVFLLPPKQAKELHDLTLGSAEEVRARGGKIIAFTFDEHRQGFHEEVQLPKTSPYMAPLLQLLVSQMLAYETAVALGRNVDRPRALAKSVTVS